MTTSSRDIYDISTDTILSSPLVFSLSGREDWLQKIAVMLVWEDSEGGLHWWLIVIYLVIVVLIQVMIVPFYPDTWWHLVLLTLTLIRPGLSSAYSTEVRWGVHPLMYHPNFDIKGIIINSLKLSQNQNIYFIPRSALNILNLFHKILDSHNHLLQSTLCYNHSLQTVATAKKKIM